ncbi:hypothetical protein KIN20_009979 [Parelaphostrongylus tenuis]|uniref:7TM GPCR serpentine receptor class x (Srx) domain-containing protein n=1 Tax=Parelaphostrongylus tenuis TaxID=148309 RepID=A0AAD5M779_PARTN|nr:hypothetical protein KIN20_009979 [Parelaphostrongylus tenuis]
MVSTKRHARPFREIWCNRALELGNFNENELKLDLMANNSAMLSHIRLENIAVSVITAAVGVLGLVLNGIAILVVRYNPALWSSFGLLCLSHIVANMGALLIFLLWIAPITLL